MNNAMLRLLSNSAFVRGPAFTGVIFLSLSSGLCSTAMAQTSGSDKVKTLVIYTHKKPASPINTQNSCSPVYDIYIEGVSLIRKDSLQEKLQPLAIQCMDTNAKQAIINAIDELHSEKGFVTTKARILNWDTQHTQRLDVKITTGRIGKLIYVEKERDEEADFVTRFSKNWRPLRDSSGTWETVNAASGLFHTIDHPLDRFQMLDGKAWPRLKMWGATAMQPGDALNTDDAQQAIDVFNSLSSNKAKYEVVATSDPSVSDLVLTNERQDSFSLVASYDLNGASLSNRDNTIDNKLQFEVTKDNLIGMNEQWRSLVAFGHENKELKGFFKVPWRRYSLELSGGYFESNTHELPASVYYYRGTEANVKGTYLLEHARTHNTKLESALGWRRIEKENNFIPETTKQISTFRLGLFRSHFKTTVTEQDSLLLGREYKYGAGVTAGLPILGAMQNVPHMSMRVPHAEFLKVDGKGELRQEVRKIGAFNFELKGQWSTDPLFSDDQQSLGSIWSVRGFINTIAKVDRGALLRSEYLPNIPAERIISALNVRQDVSFINDMIRASQPYVFYDTGYGRNIALKTNITRASFGGGVRINYGRTKLDFSLAHRLVERGTPRIPREPEAYFTISTKLM